MEGFWAHRTRYTSAGTETTVDLTAGVGNVIDILAFRAQATIALTGTLDLDLLDEDNAIVLKFADLAAAASPIATIPRLNDDVNSTTSSLAGSSWKGVRLAGADLKLRATTGALALNDTLDILVWARVLAGPGAFTHTFVTVDETVNEVY